MAYTDRTTYLDYHRAYYQRNREKIRLQNRLNYHKKREEYARRKRIFGLRRYGLTIEQYDMMLKQQKGVCASCGAAPNKNRLSVDHNHTTGKVRGLLCVPCNRLIGHLERPLAVPAMKYLRKHRIN